MKRFIALYKAFRGGEWFEASLESIREHTDGAVVVMADAPWTGTGENNCGEALEGFHARHCSYPVYTVQHSGGQSEQYEIGLRRIREEFGAEVAVLIIDTDEVWDSEMLATLRSEVESHPEAHYFRSSVYTYLRSPYYRVWPKEGPSVCVALQNAHPQTTSGRMSAKDAGAVLHLSGVAFHHFSYVRENEADLKSKFLTTSSQEARASDSGWWDRVWAHLPAGRNLHMTPGSEACWREIVHVTPAMLPAATQGVPFLGELIALEESRWRDGLRATPPAEALVPVPNDADWLRYGPPLVALLKGLPADLGSLASRLKTTYLESLWLAHWASQVPIGGRILEIGCGSGGSTAVLALASDPSVAIHTVDPFLPYDEETHAGTVYGAREGNEAAFRETAEQFSYSDRLLHRDISSTEMDGLVCDDYDLIFVDGNHSAAFVKNDLMKSWPRVKPGGLLTGHDYTTRFPGVIQEADAMEPVCDFSTPAGTSLFYARKPE